MWPLTQTTTIFGETTERYNLFDFIFNYEDPYDEVDEWWSGYRTFRDISFVSGTECVLVGVLCVITTVAVTYFIFYIWFNTQQKLRDLAPRSSHAIHSQDIWYDISDTEYEASPSTSSGSVGQPMTFRLLDLNRKAEGDVTLLIPRESVLHRVSHCNTHRYKSLSKYKKNRKPIKMNSAVLARWQDIRDDRRQGLNSLVYNSR